MYLVSHSQQYRCMLERWTRLEMETNWTLFKIDQDKSKMARIRIKIQVKNRELEEKETFRMIFKNVDIKVEKQSKVSVGCTNTGTTLMNGT